MRAPNNESGRAVLEHIIQHESPERVVAYLREAGDVAVHLIERGLCGPIGSPSRKTFAAHCLRQDKVATWRAVVEENFAGDATLAEALERTTMVMGGPKETDAFTSPETPAEAAVLAASPEGLAMVFEMDPSAHARTESRSGEFVSSLHRLAWDRLQFPESHSARSVSSARSPEDDLKNLVACCEILLEERAPWDVPDATLSGVNSMVFSLAGEGWPGTPEFHLEMVCLLGRYVEAGMLNLMSPFDFRSPHVFNGYLPLAVAAAKANPHAVGGFIRLGLPLESGLPPNSRQADFIEHLRCSRQTDAPACVAAAHEAIMWRRLEAEASQQPKAESRGPRRLGI